MTENSYQRFIHIIKMSIDNHYCYIVTINLPFKLLLIRSFANISSTLRLIFTLFIQKLYMASLSLFSSHPCYILLIHQALTSCLVKSSSLQIGNEKHLFPA